MKLVFNYSTSFQGTQTIEIEIVSLALVPDSSLLQADGKFLYVEYSFLGYIGHLLETPSLPQPKKADEPTFYHFSQKFDLNSENEKQLKILKTMVLDGTENPLKFLIVTEPVENDNNTQNEANCEEIG